MACLLHKEIEEKGHKVLESLSGSGCISGEYEYVKIQVGILLQTNSEGRRNWKRHEAGQSMACNRWRGNRGIDRQMVETMGRD